MSQTKEFPEFLNNPEVKICQVLIFFRRVDVLNKTYEGFIFTEQCEEPEGRKRMSVVKNDFENRLAKNPNLTHPGLNCSWLKKLRAESVSSGRRAHLYSHVCLCSYMQGECKHT